MPPSQSATRVARRALVRLRPCSTFDSLNPLSPTVSFDLMSNDRHITISLIELPLLLKN